MTLLQRLRMSLTLRFAAIYGSVFVVGMAIIVLLGGLRMGRLIDVTIDAYGNTVAEQLAQAALDAVMQRDQLALQGHLARLLKTQGIVSATIYDVQDHLLAQAGATPSELRNRPYIHHFPATLVLGDNVVGRTVVSIDTASIEGMRSDYYHILAASGLLVLIALVVVSRQIAQRSHRMYRRLYEPLMKAFPSLIPEADGHAAPSWPHLLGGVAGIGDHLAALQAPASEADAMAEVPAVAAPGQPDIGCAYILLTCQNLESLQRQVSRERLRVLLHNVQQHLENISQLYSGQRVAVGGSLVKIQFPVAAVDGLAEDMLHAMEAEQRSAAALQAACCAWVLAGVLKECTDGELGITLNWTMALGWHTRCDNDLLHNTMLARDDELSHWLCRQVGNHQMALSTEFADLLHQDKVVLHETSGAGGKVFYRIDRFADNVQLLLDRQIEQMQEL